MLLSCRLMATVTRSPILRPSSSRDFFGMVTAAEEPTLRTFWVICVLEYYYNPRPKSVKGSLFLRLWCFCAEVACFDVVAVLVSNECRVVVGSVVEAKSW